MPMPELVNDTPAMIFSAAMQSAPPAASPNPVSASPRPITIPSTCTLRAKRHAHPDLLRALSNRVGHDAIKSDSCQYQCDDSHDGQQAGSDLLRIERSSDELLEGCGVKDRHIRIDRPGLRAQRGEDCVWIALCSHIESQVHVFPKNLPKWHVKIGGRFAKVVILRILGYADDAKPVSPPMHSYADRITAGKEALDKCLIDDHDGRRILVVLIGEVLPLTMGMCSSGRYPGEMTLRKMFMFSLGLGA